jgi:hypothetical protein
LAEHLIRPTHSCFDDAIAYLEMRVRIDPDLVFGDALVLVHGIARAAAATDAVAFEALAPGDPFAHAWVEEGELVWQAGVLEDGAQVAFAVARTEFYAQLRIEAATRYTLRQVWEENCRSGTFGPWRPEYQALCRGGAGRPPIGEFPPHCG